MHINLLSLHRVDSGTLSSSSSLSASPGSVKDDGRQFVKMKKTIVAKGKHNFKKKEPKISNTNYFSQVKKDQYIYQVGPKKQSLKASGMVYM